MFHVDVFSTTVKSYLSSIDRAEVMSYNKINGSVLRGSGFSEIETSLFSQNTVLPYFFLNSSNVICVFMVSVLSFHFFFQQL